MLLPSQIINATWSIFTGIKKEPMKYAAVVYLVLLALNVAGQQDFDFTISTSKMDMVANGDSFNRLSIYKQIEKTGNLIRISNPKNTGNIFEYKVQYIGFQPKDCQTVFTYVILDVNGDPLESQFIYIDPVLPLVIISINGSYSYFY